MILINAPENNVVEDTGKQSTNALMGGPEISKRYLYSRYTGMTIEECRRAMIGNNKVVIEKVLVIAEFPKKKHFTIDCFWNHCLKIAPFSKNVFVRGSIVHFELEHPIDICNAHDLYELQMRFDQALWYLKEMSEFEYRFILSPNSDIQPGRTVLYGLPGYR